MHWLTLVFMLLAQVEFVVTPAFVIAAAKPKPVAVKPRHRQIVMVSGAHCSPCQRFKDGPLVKLKKAGWTVGAQGHIDVMDSTDPRCQGWDIDSIPVFILFDGDEEVDRRTGYISQWEIGKLWKTKLAPTAVLTK
jgi:thioredoxin-related protein